MISTAQHLASGKQARLKKADAGVAEAIRKKGARMRALWRRRLACQMTILPEFDEVFRAVQRSLRQAGFP